MKKTNRKQMLIASLVMLIISCVALSSATYAWFSQGNEGTVSDINFTVESASGIQLSADGANWKSAITASDLSLVSGNKVTLGENQSLTAVSTTATTLSGKTLTFYKGTFLTNGNLKSESNTDGYYVFDLYVKNEGDNKTLYLDTRTGDNKSSVSDGTPDKDTSLSTRIALYKIGSGDTSNAATENNSVGTVKIWEPNSDTHSDYAKSSGRVTSEDVTNKLSYKGLKKAGEYSVTNLVATGEEGVEVEAVNTFDKTKEEITALSGGQVTKVRVYIWMEGQDVDCNNAESGGQVSVKLAFTTDGSN